MSYRDGPERDDHDNGGPTPREEAWHALVTLLHARFQIAPPGTDLIATLALDGLGFPPELRSPLNELAQCGTYCGSVREVVVDALRMARGIRVIPGRAPRAAKAEPKGPHAQTTETVSAATTAAAKRRPTSRAKARGPGDGKPRGKTTKDESP